MVTEGPDIFQILFQVWHMGGEGGLHSKPREVDIWSLTKNETVTETNGLPLVDHVIRKGNEFR